jgi:hypothetical protein
MTDSEITDDYMREMMGTSKPYSILILKKGPNYAMEGADRIIWEHGRRNFQLRADGRLAIVLPIRAEGELSGVGVFNLTPDETREVMDEDPGVKAGVLVYEVHSTRSLPGDALPA